MESFLFQQPVLPGSLQRAADCPHSRANRHTTSLLQQDKGSHLHQGAFILLRPPPGPLSSLFPQHNSIPDCNRSSTQILWSSLLHCKSSFRVLRRVMVSARLIFACPIADYRAFAEVKDRLSSQPSWQRRIPYVVYIVVLYCDSTAEG